MIYKLGQPYKLILYLSPFFFFFNEADVCINLQMVGTKPLISAKIT
jgi:hypothetical protein